MVPTCPQCQSDNVRRQGQPAQNIVTGIRNNYVYFDVCFACGHRYDAVTETPHGVVPPGIEARKGVLIDRLG